MIFQPVIDFTHSGITVNTYVRSPRMSELEALMPVRDETEIWEKLVAPLAGQIIAINVKAGDKVAIGTRFNSSYCYENGKYNSC